MISGALLFIIPEFDLGPAAQGFVVGVVTLGALIGALLGGAAADAIGRRPTNIAGGAAFIVGSLVSAAAPDVATLIAGRFVIGIAIGLSSVAAPLYIAELAPARRRGTLVSLFQLAVTVGILVSYVIDGMLAPTRAWRTMLGVAVVPGAALCGNGMPMPNRRAAMRRGRAAEAGAALRRVRHESEGGCRFREDRGRHWAGPSGAGETWRRRSCAPLGRIGCGLQQVTGVNMIIYYAPRFQAAGFNHRARATRGSVS